MLVDYRENLRKQYADICPYSFMCRIMMGGVNFDKYTERFIKKLDSTVNSKLLLNLVFVLSFCTTANSRNKDITIDL